jgi:hypothetical protein
LAEAPDAQGERRNRDGANNVSSHAGASVLALTMAARINSAPTK